MKDLKEYNQFLTLTNKLHKETAIIIKTLNSLEALKERVDNTLSSHTKGSVTGWFSNKWSSITQTFRKPEITEKPVIKESKSSGIVCNLYTNIEKPKLKKRKNSINLYDNPKLIHELFEYRDGELYWKKKGSGRQFNERAGSEYLQSKSKYQRWYKTIGFKGKLYHVQYLIYIMFNNHRPRYIQHIDGNVLNNKIENLKAVSQRRKYKNNVSGYKGIDWYKSSNKWRCKIYIKGKCKHLGYYTDKEEAYKAYCEAADKHFGSKAQIS